MTVKIKCKEVIAITDKEVNTVRAHLTNDPPCECDTCERWKTLEPQLKGFLLANSPYEDGTWPSSKRSSS